MAEAAAAARWQRTAALMALIANCHRDRRRRPYTAADFDPTAPRAPVPRTRDLSILKDLFVRSPPPPGVPP